MGGKSIVESVNDWLGLVESSIIGFLPLAAGRVWMHRTACCIVIAVSGRRGQCCAIILGGLV